MIKRRDWVGGKVWVCGVAEGGLDSETEVEGDRDREVYLGE